MKPCHVTKTLPDGSISSRWLTKVEQVTHRERLREGGIERASEREREIERERERETERERKRERERQRAR